ncbi:uncharacterized protein [Coffea arabica]|uniref:DUF4371 domain-containing protein n=1 Tax=Coffea arabica TaxID=13443 RepID=A0ABM4UIL0_COFAR
MPFIAYVVIYIDQMWANNQVVIVSLRKDSQIGKKKDSFDVHVGGPNSAHNLSWSKRQSLLNQNQHIEVAFFKQLEQMKAKYRTRLLASIDCARFLLHQGLAFHGHDEPDIFENQGNFFELLHFLAGHNDDIKKVVLENAPKNLKLNAPDIQKDISNALASETTSIIVNDIGHGLFAILCDESRDASTKEQLAVVICYVDSHGYVIECFLGILHVRDTTALSLKKAIDVLFSKHGLTISQIRGQGYDGARNMRGEYNGLKTLIMKENGSAYYIHCFAHQLQLSLVGVAKKHAQVSSMYNTLSTLVHVLEGSSKRQEIEQHLKKVIDDLMTGELVSGWGLN